MRRRKREACLGFGRLSRGGGADLDLLKRDEAFRDRKDGFRAVGSGGDVGIGAGSVGCSRSGFAEASSLAFRMRASASSSRCNFAFASSSFNCCIFASYAAMAAACFSCSSSAACSFYSAALSMSTIKLFYPSGRSSATQETGVKSLAFFTFVLAPSYSREAMILSLPPAAAACRGLFCSTSDMSILAP